MKRPKLWTDLPYSIIKRLVETAELEYGDESSNAEAVDQVLSLLLSDGLKFHRNYHIIQELYDDLTDAWLDTWVNQEIESAKHSITVMEDFLKD